jgi:hypothetical protein
MDERVAAYLGIAPLNYRTCNTRLMQMICAVSLSPERYANESYHRNIQPPVECPHCHARDALEALGYYSRNVTSTKRGVLSIFVRRFRCRLCGRTVSILPSFAQPYRLVLNTTTNEFFGGTLGTSALSWLPLLQQYWNRFSKWIPEINRVIKSVVERSPPHPDADGWWQVLVAAFGDLEKITGTLVSRFGVTLFGRYRCHSPNTKGGIAN